MAVIFLKIAAAPLRRCQQHPRRKLGPLDAEKRLHIAHIRVLGEQPLRQRQVIQHADDMRHQNKIRPRRDALALLHRVVLNRSRFKRVHQLGALAVQRDFYQRGQPLHL